jgi:surfeit locus 1 family protein
MAGARKKFRPPLWGTIGLILGGAVCISAGLWQLDRAEQKGRLFASFDQADERATLRELVSNQSAREFRYRRFKITGRYDGDRQVLLDNMTHDGRAGYQVLTPLRTGAEAVLVNRGWIPANPDRSIMPRIDVDEEFREITGRLNPLPRPGVRLASAPLTGAAVLWPRRLSFPTVTELTEQIGYVVYDYQLLLDPEAPNGFLREWKPALMGPNGHFAYAFQWFSLAFALLVIFLVVNLKPGDMNDERA